MVWIGDKHYTQDEYMEKIRQEDAESRARYAARAKAEEAEREEAARLIRKLGAAYTEYNEFLEARPHLRGEMPANQPSSNQPSDGPASGSEAAGDPLFYELLRRNLGHADDAPRCAHIKADGIRCGSPRLKTGELCYAHQRMLERRPQKLNLPPMEDANSIQLGLMEVSRALIDRQISERTAGLLLYSLQIASSNLGRVTFHEEPERMVVDPPAAPPVIEKPAVPAPDLAIYESMDDDLKLKLQEISDEFDRRRSEKSRTNSNSGETVADGEGSNAPAATASSAGPTPICRFLPVQVVTADFESHSIRLADGFGEMLHDGEPAGGERLLTADNGRGNAHRGSGR
jgi:hypothetical protein